MLSRHDMFASQFSTKLGEEPALSFGLGRALRHPRLGLRHLLEKFAERRAQMFGIAEMRPHARPEFRLVDEFVGMSTVLKRRLGSQKKRIDVGRRTALQQLARQGKLVGQQRGVGPVSYTHLTLP